MALMRYLFKMSWMTFSFAAILSVLGGLFGAALIVVVNKGIADFELRASLAALFFVCCAAHVIAKYSSEILLLNLMQNAIFRLRVALSQQLLATPLKKLQTLGKSNLLLILTQDIGTLALAFQAMSSLLGSVVVILACFAYLAYLSWRLFLTLTITLLIAAYCYYLAVRVSLGLFVKTREKVSALYGHFRSLVEGSKELQLNDVKGAMFVESVIAPDAQGYKNLFVKAMNAYMLVANLGIVLFYLVIGVMLFIMPAWIAQPDGVYIEVILVLLYLTRPLSEMMGVLPILKQSNVSFEKIKQLGQTLSTSGLASAKGNIFEKSSLPFLEMRGVMHQSASGGPINFLIGPLDLIVNEGEVLFILGPNGSGKTTLAMLLLGLYAPEAGSILFHGVEVSEENRSHYRANFSAVFADFYLFEYLLQVDDADDHVVGDAADDALLDLRAKAYLQLLEIEHKVKVSNGKFSTIDLSTGQRKRLALVCAYLEDRPIYFFDEWAADQDPAFKEIFYTKLLPDLKAQGKTVLIISHDEAYFSCADRMVRLLDGQLLQMDEDGRTF